LQVSIIVPTYNRGEALRASLENLLQSDSTGLSAVEVIVVDDGSIIPSSGVVESIAVRHPFCLRCIRQPNSGPAAARNTGFRASHGEVVIFIDDDVVGPSDLIRRHVEAHALYPGAVIFGRCLLAPPTPVTSLFTFLNSCGFDSGENASEDFIRADVPASGHLSVERRMFDTIGGVYSGDLSTPAAEEWEFAYRLRQRGIPLLIATQIVATHHQSTELRAICAQQYRHAMGCAEVVRKYPETLNEAALRNILTVNGPVAWSDPPSMVVMKVIKTGLAFGPSRAALLKTVLIGERIGLPEGWLRGLYRTVLGIQFFAGVRDGLQRYAK